MTDTHILVEFPDVDDWCKCWQEDYSVLPCSQCGKPLTFPALWVAFDARPGDYLVHKHCLSELQKKEFSAKLIPADGWVRCVRPMNGKNFKYDELVGFVGKPVEIIHPRGSANAIMAINEEGKQNGLPVNELATHIWQDGGADASQDKIVGPALVCHTSQIE